MSNEAKEAKPKAKPFSHCRPRSDWKKAKVKGRARGIVKAVVAVGDGKNGVEYGSFKLTLSTEGLRVHRERRRKSGDLLWTFEKLAAPSLTVGRNQMRLL